MSNGSFNNYAKKVRDANLPRVKRACAIRSCVQMYCRNVGGSYFATIVHIEHRVHKDLFNVADELDLYAALRLMEVVRDQVTAIRREYDRERKLRKMLGQRIPSRDELLALAEAVAAARSTVTGAPEVPE